MQESGNMTGTSRQSAGSIAARYLCPKQEIQVGFVGAGPRAEAELESLLQYFTICGIRIWDPDNRRTEAFRKRFNRYEMEICNQKRACDCDLLITTTGSQVPVVRARWVRSGAHINALGAGTPGRQELDPTLLALGRVFVDDRERAVVYGEIARSVAAGFFNPERIAGTIEDVIQGRPGRTSDREITIFDLSDLTPPPLQQPLPEISSADHHLKNNR